MRHLTAVAACLLLSGAFSHAMPYDVDSCERLLAPARVRVLRDYLARHTPASDPTVHKKTIGIEVEGIVPYQTGRDGLAAVMQATLKAALPRNVARTLTLQASQAGPSYKAVYRERESEQAWELKSEGSISPPDGYHGAELASAVLKNPRDFRLFHTVLERLRDAGFQPEPLSAGVHIHVGFPRPTLEEVAVLARLFSLVEDGVLDFFGMSPTRSHAAQRTSQAVIEVVDRFEENTYRGFFDRVFPGEVSHYRSRALNLTSLKTHGTVEFRFFNSTLNADVIMIMQEFCWKFVRAVRSKDPGLVAYLDTAATEGINLAGLAAALEIPLDQWRQTIRETVVSDFPAIRPLPEVGLMDTDELSLIHQELLPVPYAGSVSFVREAFRGFPRPYPEVLTTIVDGLDSGRKASSDRALDLLVRRLSERPLEGHGAPMRAELLRALIEQVFWQEGWYAYEKNVVRILRLLSTPGIESLDLRIAPYLRRNWWRKPSEASLLLLRRLVEVGNLVDVREFLAQPAVQASADYDHLSAIVSARLKDK